MVFQAFGTPSKTSWAMHEAIQEMQFFLRTAFQTRVELKKARIHAGKWSFPSRLGSCVNHNLACAYKRRVTHKLAGILYVDDTGMVHLNMKRIEEIHETHQAMQSSLDSWSQLLIATGGALKPEKCFYYLIGFKWDRHGKWQHENLEGKDEYKISVTLPDQTRVPIEHSQ
eukprot:CCRYP_020334-RA/>CCRYP_020334-RA protein AED:0.43 eAED:0.54 QI:0/0/0/1/0/0/3/0/169